MRIPTRGGPIARVPLHSELGGWQPSPASPTADSPPLELLPTAFTVDTARARNRRLNQACYPFQDTSLCFDAIPLGRDARNLSEI